ncbi:MAG: SDR family oxidoreductase [Pseudomonadota bacterium]
MIMKDLFSLKDRVAVVTGGSRGIGKMIAQGFLEQGAKVYITARKAPACDQTAEELSKLGGSCISLPHDLSTLEGIDQFVQEFGTHEDGLDILVNNAGAAWGEDFTTFPESGWDKVMDLNVKSPFFLTKALHTHLKKRASSTAPSKVINIASIDGVRINPWETYSYQASKAAMIHLTRRMAARLIKDQIAVSAIAPGAFASDMNRAARDAGDAVGKMVPAGRIGEDSDMAGTAVYLASRAGNYVVGETVAVDGGVAYSSTGESWG